MSKADIINSEQYKVSRASVDWYQAHQDADCLDGFEAGAQWQKEQTMKDAIECYIDYYDGPILDCTQKQLDDALEKTGAKVGDKVKLLIVKDE